MSERQAPLVIESVCHECGRLRSKRFALVVEVHGRELFLCQECCDYYYAHGLGYDREALRYFLKRKAWIKNFVGSAMEAIDREAGYVA